MRFSHTDVAGALLVDCDLFADSRGFFTRLCCAAEFRAAGVDFAPLQTSLSRNLARHTLRGMHYCREAEPKLVRCTRGRIFDVMFDIRRDSATFGRAIGVELSPENMRGLYIPEGVAHGFLTLEPDSDVLYEIGRVYRPGFDAGLRWNDPLFAFNWPATPAVIDQRDEEYPDFV